MNDLEEKSAVTPAGGAADSAALQAGNAGAELDKGGGASPVLEIKPSSEKAGADAGAGFFRKLVGAVGQRRRDGLRCTCSRKAGISGRHTKECAISKARLAEGGGGDGGSMFSPPPAAAVAAGVAVGDAAPLGAAPVPAVPADYSFWSALGKSLATWRVRLDSWRVKKKCKPVVGEEEAKGLAGIITLPEEMAAEIGTSLEECARHYQWTPGGPAGKLALQWVNLEGHLMAQMSVIETRLKEIRDALLKSQKSGEKSLAE